MVQFPNTGSTRRARRALATREAILRAAAGVFRARGFADTGMREIAVAADLSPANLYYYFASKADLLFFCQEHAVRRLLERAAALKAAARDAPTLLRRIITAHLVCTLDEVDGAAAHTAVDALPPERRARIVAQRDRYERMVRAVVAGGMRRGVFAKGDATLITRAILGALNWTSHWYRPGGTLSATILAETYADFLVKGLEP